MAAVRGEKARVDGRIVFQAARQGTPRPAVRWNAIWTASPWA